MLKPNTLCKPVCLAVLIGCLLLTSTGARAGEPVVWEMSSRAELLKGEARGVSVTDVVLALTSGPGKAQDRVAAVVSDLRTTLQQRKLLEVELERRAFHDPLTGLPNRALFEDRLETFQIRIRLGLDEAA